MLRDLVIAISLANVIFLKWWVKLLDLGTPYHALDWPASVQYPAMMLNVLALGGLFWLAVRMARRASSSVPLELAQVAFLLVVLVGIPHLYPRISLLGYLRPLQIEAATLHETVIGLLPLLLHLLGLVAVGWLIVRWRRAALTTLALLFLILSPVALLSFVRAASLWFAPHPPLESMVSASLLETATPRIVWLVFDEFDQRVGFEERPERVRMPALDRLRQESVYAANAYPPAGETLHSMPAFITGRLVRGAERIRAGELQLHFGDWDGNALEREGWSTVPSVFTRVRELGGNSALVGMYHPYCRILGEQLADCLDVAYSLRPRISRDSSLLDAMALQLCRVVENYPVLYRCNSSAKRAELARSFERMLERAREQVRDARYHVVFLHFGVPHLPGIYDVGQQRLSDSVGNNYFDNLELADHLVAEIRRELEAAGLWDTTTFVVTSDHSMRTETWHDRLSWTPEEESSFGPTRDHRVPLLVKFPGQSAGVEITEPINALVLHDLSVAVASGEITNGEEGARWLSQAAGNGRSPYD